MLMVLATSASLTTVVKYKTIVRAPMTIRPDGELRLVQSPVGGTVVSIGVQENHQVDRGQTIATLDSSKLRTQKRQIEESISETRNQLAQVNAQIALLTDQIATEKARVETTTAMAEAELAGSQRSYSNLQVATSADVREAQANLQLAEEELMSYQQLVEQGAIAQLELAQKQAAVESASAQLDKLTAALNPTNADVTVAQEKIAQTRARGAVAVSQLRQTQSQLMQQRSEINETLNSNTQKLEQVINDLMRTELKAPTAGTIQALSLRNANQVIQPGETVARIFPDGAELKVQALVPSKEISKVSVDQPVKMRISACPFSQFGTLPGVVRTISPDANSTTENENNGQVGDTFYNVMVEPQKLTLKAGDKECPIQSGIEGRAEIIAREETIFDFILRKTSLAIHR